MSSWTAEQVLALAPDPASAKAGRTLAVAGKWLLLGNTRQALWGECKGSGAKPYQTQVELGEPAFKCSCPSRKFPCKHALGLFLLFTTQSEAFTAEEEPPAWVGEWLAKRERSTQAKRAKAADTANADDPEQQAQKTVAKAKRASQRQAKVTAGLAELERWLGDLIRQGLAHAQTQPVRYWDNMASRLVDAQAPGLARWIREMSGIAASGEGWNERLLAKLGLLQLLLAAHGHLDRLPEPLQADVRTQIGWTYKAEDLPPAAWLQDDWSILGQRGFQEDRLQVRRTWLWGRTHRRQALLLEFAFQGQALDPALVPGRQLAASVGYLPSAYPLRAILGERHDSVGDTAVPADGYGAITDFLTAYAEALSRQPWLENFPVTLRSLAPGWRDEQLLLSDPQGQALPLHPGFPNLWHLLALSGGEPCHVFGEWDGRHLWPLSVWAQGQTAYF
ncbi:MAG: SWIM zinc finger family protein [Gammaproteobacteria bacterium]|nr:SWIM zinc finger family protein [Gammaproteobacteria bacterium]MCP5423845.1 SWIM zinc finger family protein [Gammaproteobacteria bacterium]